MNIFLAREQGISDQTLEQVQKMFQRHPGPLVVKTLQDPVALPVNGAGSTLAWTDVFSALRELRRREGLGDAPFLHLLTKTDNELYWYAVEDDENMRNGFIHSGNFSWVSSAPDYAINAHWIMKSVFNALLAEAEFDWESMWHRSAIGCFFDFCEEKADLNFKLRTADICAECLTKLQTLKFSDSLLRQSINVMESIRKLSVNTSQYVPAEAGFQLWPFPVAITRHRVVQVKNPLLRFLRLLDHFDSLVRYVFLAHESVSGRKPIIGDRPSLGWWVDALAGARGRHSHIRQAVTIAQEERVVKLRNETRGHGWMAREEEGYKQDADRLEKVITAIEGELRPFLEKYQLVIPSRIHLQGGAYTVEGSLLVGSHLLHPEFSMKLACDVRESGIEDEESVYVTDLQFSRFHPISPLIRKDTCPECRHPRVLISDGGNTYIDLFMGHRVNL